MAAFRIEIPFDVKSGLFYAELYYPDNATVPFVTSAPRYLSQDQAQADIIESFRRMLNSN